MDSAAQEGSPRRSRSFAPAPGLKVGPVLLAVHGQAEPTAALQRAGALAGAFDNFLAVLRVRTDALVDGGRPPWMAGHAGDAPLLPPDAQVAEETTAWVEASLGRARRSPRVLVAHGGFDSEVVHTARTLGASVIVLASDAEQRAEHATYLALRSGVPVLVARAPQPGGAIVAATDLDTSDFPVLTRAAELAARLRVGAVFVHNVAPVADRAASADARREHLAGVARALVGVAAELAPDAMTRVTEHPTPTDAVLAVAGETDADLVVVGARQRSWLGRVLGGLMAERTAWRARRSVLIVPMTAAGESRR